MAGTQPLRDIVIDYSPENCRHRRDTNTIELTFDHRGQRGGSCWHSPTRFLYGTFSAWIKCPPGNTSGLNFNFYLSSLEGDNHQDEIDFEILGNNMTVVETDYHINGRGKHEDRHDLGFNCSEEFHKYEIQWSNNVIEWYVDGISKRRVAREITKPMYLYSSIWNASKIDKGRWAGRYVGCDAPYVCVYRDVHVPVGNAVEG